MTNSAVARFVYDYFMELDYFKEHPDYVKCFQTKNDFVERHSTYAYVKGTKGDSNRTIILLGHIDTVGVDDFGPIREYAFKCDELPEKLKETFKLSDEVLADIESGEYLFGRGALDMKSGVAGHMYLLKYFSEHTDELDGNIIMIAECDEEDNSKGIITQGLVMIDSLSYVDDRMITSWKGTYDNIHDNQVEWYEAEIKRMNAENKAIDKKAGVVSTQAFFHIPLVELKDAWNEFVENDFKDTEDFKYIDGIIGEGGRRVYCGLGEDDLFEKMLALPRGFSVKVVNNNWQKWGKLDKSGSIVYTKARFEKVTKSYKPKGHLPETLVSGERKGPAVAA